MKKLFMSLMIICIVLPSQLVFADTITTLDNYYYAHANTAGSFDFHDKYGTVVMLGDGVENDAQYETLLFTAQGMQTGDKIIVEFTDSTTIVVTPGQTIDVTNKYSTSISARLVKTGTNEVYAKLTKIKVHDDSYHGSITYTWDKTTPSHFGGTVPPPEGGGEVPIIPSNYYYAPFKDQYRLDYNHPVPGATKYQLHYTSPSGTVYTRDYDFAPTGIHWLTCNGTYEMRFMDSSGGLVGKTATMTTNQIQNATCASYEDNGAGSSDFTASKVKDPSTGNYNIKFDPPANAAKCKVFKDGQQLGTDISVVRDGRDHGLTSMQDGSFTVICYNAAGNPIGQADLAPDATGGTDPGSGTGGGCNGCDWIKSALACPQWDDYMKEWEDMIRRAVPPPPDWDQVADTFVNHFADYFGDVPTPPTVPQIDSRIRPPLPPINTDVPGSELIPTVPNEFDNGPLPFDITQGPQIPVVDESEPIEIYDPDKYIEHDSPGQMVLPGDPRNNSNGIKEPDRIQTENPIPQPTPRPDNPIPPSDIPTPGPSSGTTPQPGDIGGIIPIPQVTP